MPPTETLVVRDAGCAGPHHEGVEDLAGEKKLTWALLDHAMIARCFAGLETAGRLLLAVSGGPDSMALMLMAARWAANSGVPFAVATVDHGWRPEARAEAEMVASAATRLGLPHTILTCTEPKPATRRQERARVARYALLAAHAREIGASHIVTAHHADDQAETILFRLGRGSGLAGLAGMRRLKPLAPGLILARPLLKVSKADLVAFCRAESCAFAVDLSNHDPAYARTRLRAAAPALAALGLDREGLLRLARRVARAEQALEAEADRVEALLKPTHGDGTYRLGLASAPMAPEIGLRLLRRAIAHVAGARPIRLERLEGLTDAIFAARADGRSHKATLAGTRVTLATDGVLTVTAEAPRRRGQRGAQIGSLGAAALSGQTSLRPN